MTEQQPLTELQVNVAPAVNQFRAEVIAGLTQPQKELPCKYLYDEQGSRLFDQICELTDYYPTRTETSIMETHVHEMAELIGRDCLLIEYGSGSSMKSRILLQAMQQLAAYVPIDISCTYLQKTVAALKRDFANLEILPVCADYSQPFELPEPRHPVNRRCVYFPGSTIGNSHPEEAVALLQSIARVCQPGGGLLLGVDLKKDPARLHQAYNDREGVTAAFNLNMLTRINRELGADFQPEQYRHYAFYNPYHGRIEIHLVSMTEQQVQLDDIAIPLREGETIWTESSYKYTPAEFARLAETAGFAVTQIWTDPQKLFSVQFLTAQG
jgi:dimethylhistidine N-methyltransferase